MRGLSAQLALCLLFGAVVACTASVDSQTWFPENPSLEFIPGKTALAVIGARNLGKTEVNISAAWAQLALVSNTEGSIYNFFRCGLPDPCIIEESKIVDTELLGLYVILLACFAAAAYGALTLAQGKGWVKKPRKNKSAPAVASGDKSEWLKGTVADKSSKKIVKQS
ncbi:hypothetical protein Ndes2526A_g07829 [Nannochloris sp. 'desiccata']